MPAQRTPPPPPHPHYRYVKRNAKCCIFMMGARQICILCMGSHFHVNANSNAPKRKRDLKMHPSEWERPFWPNAVRARSKRQPAALFHARRLTPTKCKACFKQVLLGWMWYARLTCQEYVSTVKLFELWCESVAEVEEVIVQLSKYPYTWKEY